MNFKTGVSTGAVIHDFSSGDNSAKSGHAFILSWNVDADKIDLYRNGIFYQTLGVSQQTLERTEFYNDEKDVCYELITYKDGLQSKSKPVYRVGSLWISNHFFLVLFPHLLIFPIIYFIIAGRIAFKTGLNLAWQNKLYGWLSPKLSAYLAQIESKQPNWLHNISKPALVKLKLIQTNKADNNVSGWEKRIFSYALKKIRMNDVDFRKENIQLSNIPEDKIFKTISKITRPSSKLLWLFVIIHTILFILLFTYAEDIARIIEGISSLIFRAVLGH